MYELEIDFLRKRLPHFLLLRSNKEIIRSKDFSSQKSNAFFHMFYKMNVVNLESSLEGHLNHFRKIGIKLL